MIDRNKLCKKQRKEKKERRKDKEEKTKGMSSSSSSEDEDLFGIDEPATTVAKPKPTALAIATKGDDDDNSSDDDSVKKKATPATDAKVDASDKPDVAAKAKSLNDALFDGSDSSDEDEITDSKPTAIKKKSSGEEGERRLDMDDIDEDEDEQQELEPEKVHFKLEVPVAKRPPVGSNFKYARVPKFMRLVKEPFDENAWQKDMVLAQEGEGPEAKWLNAKTSIRWRYKTNETGERVVGQDDKPQIESNTRIVEWSDGSLQLLIGNEAYNMTTNRPDSEYIYARGNKTLECHGKVEEDLRFQPVDSLVAMNLSGGGGSKVKKGRVKEMQTIVDPERQQDERAKAIDQSVRTRQRQRARQEHGRGGAGADWEEGFMEEGYDQSNSIRAAKGKGRAKGGGGGARKRKSPSSAKKGKKRSNMSQAFGSSDEESEDSEDEDDEEDSFIDNDEDEVKWGKDESEEDEAEDSDDSSDGGKNKKKKKKGTPAKRSKVVDSDDDSD